MRKPIPHKHWLLLVCVMLGFAVIGTASLLISRAQSISDNTITVDPSTPYTDAVQPSSGEVKILAQNPSAIYLQDDLTTKASMDPWHVAFHIVAAANIYDLACAPGINCRRDGSSHVGKENYTYYGPSNWSSDWYVCVNLSPTHAGKLTELFTLSVDAPYTLTNNSYWKDWVVDTMWATGPCSTVNTDQPNNSNYSQAPSRGSRNVASRSMGSWGDRSTGNTPSPIADPSSPSTEGPGGGNEGAGPGKTGSGNSTTMGTESNQNAQSTGASSGAIANTVSNIESSVPEPSPSGLQAITQAIIPTAFFDGKSYQPSALSIEALSKTSSNKQKVFWLSLMPLVVIICVLVCYYKWRRRKQ